MPISNYNSAFGGKPGSAQSALDSMKDQYGETKGTKVFYATKNKRKKKVGVSSVKGRTMLGGL